MNSCISKPTMSKTLWVWRYRIIKITVWGYHRGCQNTGCPYFPILTPINPWFQCSLFYCVSGNTDSKAQKAWSVMATEKWAEMFNMLNFKGKNNNQSQRINKTKYSRNEIFMLNSYWLIHCLKKWIDSAQIICAYLWWNTVPKVYNLAHRKKLQAI